MKKIIVPMVPPSVNRYMRTRIMHPKSGGPPFVQYYPTAEAKSWWRAIRTACKDVTIEGEEFEVAYIVYVGKGKTGDVDNFSKCIFDGLCKKLKDDELPPPVIPNDYWITDFHGFRRRDANHPRTEIYIREAGQINLLNFQMPSLSDWAL